MSAHETDSVRSIFGELGIQGIVAAAFASGAAA
jgi:hypothetical protein